MGQALQYVLVRANLQSLHYFQDSDGCRGGGDMPTKKCHVESDS